MGKTALTNFSGDGIVDWARVTTLDRRRVRIDR
jgi:hypothetical protein